MQFDKQAALKELGISEEMYGELLQIFIKQADTALKNLQESVELGDLGEIAKSAHFIHGSAANLRLEGMRALAKNIELQAKGDKDLKTIREDLLKLKQGFEELKLSP